MDTKKTATTEMFVDPLEALLKVDSKKLPTMVVPIARPDGTNFKVTVEGLGQEAYDNMVEECSTYSVDRKTRAKQRNLDSRQLQRLIISRYTRLPNLSDATVQGKLKAHYGLNESAPAEMLVPKVFLPGEIDKISDAIMECSGFTDDLVAEAKNS